MTEEREQTIKTQKQSSSVNSNTTESVEDVLESVINPSSSPKHVRISSQLFIRENIRKEVGYEEKGVLGEGSYGKVVKVQNSKTSSVRAMKIINKKENDVNENKITQFMKEVDVLRKLDHPNILKIYEFYQDSENFYIITELCEGGELFDRVIDLGSLSEREAALIMQQVLSAVSYAHKNNVVHRDLKPENIMLEKKIESDDDESSPKENCDVDIQIKVIDWGIAVMINPKRRLTSCIGTDYYMAPEVFKKDYDHKCDIWSCGVILYMLISGQPPFKGTNTEKVKNSVVSSAPSFECDDWQMVSDEAKDIINLMLNKDPTKRPTAEEVLAHKWFDKMLRSSGNKRISDQQMLNNLKRLKNFKTERKMQQAVLTFIAMFMASNEERESLKKIFVELDTNNDGILSKEEIIEGYVKIMGREEAELEANRIMEAVDIDHNGHIEYSEFLTATMDYKKLICKGNLEEAFRLFDEDNNGFIYPEEVKAILDEPSNNLSEDVWKRVIGEVDTNGDGKISFEEFTDMMTRFITYNEGASSSQSN